MRLVHDHSDGAYAVKVQCYHCSKMITLADMTIDLDGPSFRAYYCPGCAPKGVVQPCDRSGCCRCNDFGRKQ